MNAVSDTVLITGITGCLGKTLERFLLQKGLKVIGLTRSPKPQSASHIHCLYEREELAHIFNAHSFRAVFHVASPTERDRNLGLLDLHFRDQILLTQHLLDACPTTTRFFFASTTEVYGDASGAASEERAVSPVSPYSYGKASAEMLIKLYRKLRGGDYTIFRIYNFFGDGLPPQHFISQLLDALEKKQPFPMTAGQQRRDIVSVEFVAQALYTALLSDNITNQTLNICRGISIPLQELASHIAEHYGARNLLQLGALPYRDNEVWDSHGDPEKLFALLGLRASPDWRSEVSQWLASRSSGKTA